MDALITAVNKEDLHNYHFSNREVLTEPDIINQRRVLLEESLLLGNDYKTKVHMFCQTTEGIIDVYTTVWALTDTHVEIKSGKDIPIHCIHQVII